MFQRTHLGVWSTAPRPSAADQNISVDLCLDDWWIPRDLHPLRITLDSLPFIKLIPSDSLGFLSVVYFVRRDLSRLYFALRLVATVVRNASHLPAILSSHSSSPSYPSFAQQTLSKRPSTPNPVVSTQVILVPLCDSPSLPSLSLLLSQGTTPTAVCFQQDILERAKRTEEEWLPYALGQIQTVQDMRDRSIAEVEKGKRPEEPVILAYSANPALSPSTIAACVGAGASGVLKPPYDLETARSMRRMVRAAREGRISSTVGSSDHVPSRSLISEADEPSVILPSTALSMGGEYEGEKVLNAVVRNHQRGMSVVGSGKHAPGARTRQDSASHILPRHHPSVTALPALNTTHPISPLFPDTDHDHYQLASLYRYSPAFEPRRRSIDVAGLGIALRRAQRAFEAAAVPSPVTFPSHTNVASTYSFPASPTKSTTKTHTIEDDLKDTELAELLSAMYNQTMVTIQIKMEDYVG